jgi:hypothetical protein
MQHACTVKSFKEHTHAATSHFMHFTDACMLLSTMIVVQQSHKGLLPHTLALMVAHYEHQPCEQLDAALPSFRKVLNASSVKVQHTTTCNHNSLAIVEASTGSGYQLLSKIGSLPITLQARCPALQHGTHAAAKNGCIRRNVWLGVHEHTCSCVV